MPAPYSSTSKAILVNLGVFIADNNVRRNVANSSHNFTSPTASTSTNAFTLLPGETLSLSTSMSESSVTIITCNSTVTCDFTFSSSSGVSPYSVPVGSLHVVHADVRSIVISNSSTTTASAVMVIQS